MALITGGKEMRHTFVISLDIAVAIMIGAEENRGWEAGEKKRRQKLKSHVIIQSVRVVFCFHN